MYYVFVFYTCVDRAVTSFSLVTPVYSLYFCIVLFTRFNKLNDDDDDDYLGHFKNVDDDDDDC